MRSLSKILLPVDFSERSAGAARYAIPLAAHFHSELILLHVLTPPQLEFGALDISGSMLAELYRTRSEQAVRELDAFLAPELEGIAVRRLILEGDPSVKIVEQAHELSAGLILMPTHGYGPFRRFILGSNTAKVLHDADCPVWTCVHLEESQSGGSHPPREILCAVDLGAQSSQTLCWAALLARDLGAHLSLVHVTASPGSTDASAAEWHQNLRSTAELELRRLREFVNADADLLVESGEAPHAICSAAARIPADLLVIGRGSAAGVFGRLRTNAYAIIRQSPCPVVSV